MYTEIETTRPIVDIEKEFDDLAAKHGFNVLGVHDLKMVLSERGELLKKGCLVYDVCNPTRMKKVLEHNMALASALPCRIAVYEKHGKTHLSTINPVDLLSHFSFDGLRELAAHVEKELLELMKDLARAK